MSQIHDNIITAYQVDFENQRLTIQTKYHYGGQPYEKTDIVFENYFTHCFDNEQKGSVLFDITECSAQDFVKKEHELLLENRKYSWPINYTTPNTIAEFTSYMEKNEYRIFEVNSSYGLYGWVLAGKIEIIVNEI